MKIGYARVSTDSQNLDRQIDALTEYKVEEIITEKMSGTIKSRPSLDRLLDKARKGDTVVVESLSRLGRSTKDLLFLVEQFSERGIILISLKESIDISSPTGKLLLTVLSALSQFERDLTVQRTREGLQAARARGRTGGRKPVNPKTIERAMKMYDTKQFSISEIEKTCNIGRATLYKYRDIKRIM